MSNYDSSDNISNRTHNKSNVAINFNSMADTKLPNIQQTITQAPPLFFSQQPYYQHLSNFYINSQSQLMPVQNNQLIHNTPYPQMQPSQQYAPNMVAFNQNPNNNMYPQPIERQLFVYQQQPNSIQTQMQHASHIQPTHLSSHIPPQNASPIPQHLQQQQQQQQIQQQHHQQQHQHMQPQQMHQHMHQFQQIPSSQSHIQHMQIQTQQFQHMQQPQHILQIKQPQPRAMQPHIRPQMPNPIYSLPQSFQPPPSNVLPEKPVKMSSALEIRNPDTLECIDLHSFKPLVKGKDTPKTVESHNNVKNDSVKNVKEFHISVLDKLKNDECDQSDINIEPFICKSETNISIDELSNHEPDDVKDSESIHEAVSIDLENINQSDIIEMNDEQTQNDIISNNEDVDQRFIYTREELIRIGKSPLSRIKPKGLPVKDKFTDPIILEHPMNISYLNTFESIQGMNQKSTKPKKAKDENMIYEIHSINRNQQGHPNLWRHNISKNSNAPRYIDLGVAELPLMRSEDGYVTFKQRLASGEELNQTEELVRQIKGILNRIVPQNFDQCLSDLVSLKVGTHEGMTCLVNELFLKAVKEEAYSVTFAKICSYLASIKADVSENEIVTFRSVLLQKCQAMFTTPLEEQLEKVRQDWLEKASIEKPKTKALMESDVEEQVKKAKDRYYGNIRFIGELYLKGVLITKIICFCIENLISKENDSDSLICLCKLLETCGSKLETETKGKEKLNNACKTLRDFTESQYLETRVRFRILDILEMRDKKWLLRKIQQEQKIEPKTLEEIKLEKEMEEEKDYYHSLNRRNPHTWNADRRQSLPTVNKNRSSITPKQLSVNSSEPTVLGPTSKNWSHGSGYKSKCDVVIDTDKRTAWPKFKPGINGSDISQIVESCEASLAQLSEAEVEGCNNDHLHLPLCHSPANSSQNSSRSSSQSRSLPLGLSREKLPDSKLAQDMSDEVKLFSPDQLLKEHMTNNVFCERSWNSYTDKATVVYKWLDINFDTNSDKRRSLSNLLSLIINQGVLDKEDLLKAFAKLLDLLEDLLIDVGNALWDSFTDYIIPFVESMDMSSIDIVENIFNTTVFQNFCRDNASIIYSLPWSIINGILKIPDAKINPNIFQLAINPDEEDLTDCNKRLLDIVEINILKAISIQYQMKYTDYEKWVYVRLRESKDIHATRYFLVVNFSALLCRITPDTFVDEKLNQCFNLLSSLSTPCDVFQALVNISHEHSLDVKDIFRKLYYLVNSSIYSLDDIVNWQSESHNRNRSNNKSRQLPPNLAITLDLCKSKSAFTHLPCESLQFLLSVDNCVDCCSTTTTTATTTPTLATITPKLSDTTMTSNSSTINDIDQIFVASD